MTRLIAELKEDHERILAILRSVQEAGITSAHGKQALSDARDTILAHLAREDEKLYPALRSAAKRDPALRAKLAEFAQDTEEVSEAAHAFFRKKRNDNLELVHDYAEFLRLMRDRMEREERIIYPEYERLKARRA